MTDNPLQNSTENNLALNIYQEGISYAVSDENQQVILRQELNIPIGTDMDMHIFEHFFNQPELQILGENVNILYESNQYQLIPNELFAENDLKQIFELEHGESEKETLLFKILPKWGANLVFRVPTGILNFFEQKYPDAEIEHTICMLLKKRIVKSESALWLNLRKGMIDIVVVQNNELLLLTTFQVKTAEDSCYFVLNIYDQLQLDVESFSLNIISNNAINEELVLLLKQYIKQVEVRK